MSQAAITVGSKVRVTRVRDRIPADLVTALQSDATGTVKDFKVTDGKGIGVVVELSNGTTTWFFAKNQVVVPLLSSTTTPMPLPSVTLKSLTVPVASLWRAVTRSAGMRSRTRVTRTFEPTVMAAWDMSGATKKWRQANPLQALPPWSPNGSFPASMWPMAGW